VQKHAKGRDRFVLDRPPTQMEIAARVFSNRETVAREMGRMRNMGLIGRDGRSLCIPSVKALEAYVMQSGKRARFADGPRLVSA